MPLIHECVVTTLTADGAPHLAPLGLIENGPHLTIAPFRPSATLTHLMQTPKATASFTDDTKIFAKLVTGDRFFPLTEIENWPVPRLASALSHAELSVIRVEENDTRPQFICRIERIQNHQPFLGMNRARAAIIEAAILSTRLERISREKIENELAYLRIAIDKTAGPTEIEAWTILMEKINKFLGKT